MKRRRQQKEAAKKQEHRQHDLVTASPQAILRRARSCPILECWISDNWQGDDASGLVQILLARQQPRGDVAYGVYLIDYFCLGLKNTFCAAGISRGEYEDDVRDPILATETFEACTPELAHQMIYSAIDYAAQFGFKPQRDFAESQYLLAPRGELDEPYTLTFGKDGKPFYVAGPHDNVPAILARLERSPGSGNYDYLVPLDMPTDDLDL